MKVTLRKRAMTKGRSSLYLDIYPPILHPDTGKLIRRQFLGIYLLDKPRTDLDRIHNRETQKLAEYIRATRQLEVQNKQYGFLSDEKRNASFVEFFKSIAVKKAGSNSDNWYMALRYFADFSGPDLRFSDLNLSFCKSYRAHMLKAPAIGRREIKISNNTALSYFNKFKAVLREAYEGGLLIENLNEKVNAIKEEETHREYLTIEEFQKLAETPVKNNLLKKAAIFSGLTGLRFSDVTKIQWVSVRGVEGEYYLQYRQKKTAGAEVLPISDTAYGLLGERMDDNRKVFAGVKYSQVKTFLLNWVADAGIRKNITFHSFRHTYATLQLANGTDIFTVSKLLGHRHVKTTQIYTKVIDSKKKEAANRINIKIT
jgi:integrase